MPWSPAGIPMQTILQRCSGLNTRLWKSRRTLLFSVTRNFMTRKALIASEHTVAIATPDTPISKHATKTMLRMTFITPDAARAINGLFVSPMDRRIADPKLYTMRKGIPTK